MQIKNLYKRYGDKVIFNDYSEEIPDNQITYITGDSGIGKTTLLNLIAGLDKDFEGEISKDSNNIAYVFQYPRLFPSVNVYNQLSIINSNKSIDDILKIVELENDTDLFPDELSGGMKMRVALARALYCDADIYLLDEPFSSIDEEMKYRIRDKVFDILKGKTIIVVSHDNDEASKYANKIIKL